MSSSLTGSRAKISDAFMIFGRKGTWAVDSGSAVAYCNFSYMELEKYDQMLKLNMIKVRSNVVRSLIIFMVLR